MRNDVSKGQGWINVGSQFEGFPFRVLVKWLKDVEGTTLALKAHTHLKRERYFTRQGKLDLFSFRTKSTLRITVEMFNSRFYHEKEKVICNSEKN